MARAWKRLTASGKIKDEYTHLNDNAQYGEELEVRVDDHDTRITDAQDTADAAQITATAAAAEVGGLQAQIDQLVIEGDSSVEAAQARVSTPKGITFDVLKDRLDASDIDLMQRGVNVGVAPYTATGDGVTDDWAAIQQAINDMAAAGGGVVYVPAGVYAIYQTLVVASHVYLVGVNRNKTILSKRANHPYTGRCGVEKDAVIYLDYAANDEGYHWRSRIQDLAITSFDRDTITGVYLGNATQCEFNNLLISQCFNAFASKSIWIMKFYNVRTLMHKGYAYQFNNAEEKTTLNFENCYSEADGGVYNIRAGMYISFRSCAADWTNVGGMPTDPYNGGGGNYQSLSFVYNLSACKGVTITSCGTENSYASWLYSEDCDVTVNSCYLYGWYNNYTPTGDNFAALIQLRGTARSTVRVTASRFENMTNQVAKRNQIKGIHVEMSSKQKVLLDNYIRFDDTFDFFNQSTYSKNGVHFAVGKTLTPDPTFKSNIDAAALPFMLHNGGTFTAGALAYTTNVTTKNKSVLISTTGTNAPNDDSTVNHDWMWMFNRDDIRGKIIRLKVAGAQTAGGGIGNPTIRLAHADDAVRTGEEVIRNITLSDLSSGVDWYMNVPNTVKSVVYFLVRLPFKVVAFRLDELRVDVCDIDVSAV